MGMAGVGRPPFGGRPVRDEDKRPIKKATVRRVVATFRPYRARVAVVAVAIVITAGLGVVNPLLIRAVFDNALFGDPPGNCSGGSCPQLHLLYTFVALMIAIPVVTSVIGIGQTYL